MRFRVFGSVCAENQHGQVPLGSSRQRAVLATLLVEPGALVSMDQLVDRVWGASPPQRVRQTLHTYLSRLRSVLAEAGGPVLIRRSGGYALSVDPSAVDLYRFRALVAQARQVAEDERAATVWQEALDLWRGRPFADVDSDWLERIAVGLEAERLAAVLDRADVLLRRGEHSRLLPELTAAAAEHPLDERLTGQLMLALYRCGRQADALARYMTLRNRLAEDLGSDPGPALRELHQRILRHDPELAAVPRGNAVPAAADPPSAVRADLPPLLAQLPADTMGFTGRAADLRGLDELLHELVSGRTARAVVITAIGGAGGVGKTALAVHWAHRVRDQFPDGQVYLNLRGFDPGGQVMTPGDALRALLELLGVPPERIPSSVEAQAGLYRSRLAGVRMLLVLDNARDGDQVRPLLPGSGSTMVVVTRRDQLAGLVAAGARPVRLDVLDEDEARQLLVHRLGPERVAAEPDAVDMIVDRCAGLPLALTIVAARAAMRPRFDLAVFARELADARSRLDALASRDVATDVRAVFSWSYLALSLPAAKVFRLLGLHPGPDIGLTAVASLAALSTAEVRRSLAELSDAHLVTEHAPGRYTMHDLLRIYAAELAHTVDAEPDRRAARYRMLDYYLHSAQAADRWLPEGRTPTALPPPEPGVLPESFSTNAEARGWLATETAVFLAVIEQSGEDEFDRHSQYLAWTLATYLQWRGLWYDQISAQTVGLRAAHRRADQRGQADFHRYLARAHVMVGRPDEGQNHFRQSLALCERLGDHTGQARAHLGLRLISEKEGRHQDGLFHSQCALESARAADDRGMQALIHNAIGWSHSLLGQYAAGIVHCQRSLTELEELGEVVHLADVWDSLGYAHHGMGQYQQAIGYYRQAAERCRAFGSHYREATVLTHLGDTYLAVGDDDTAREVWRRALSFFEEASHADADNLRKRLDGLTLAIPGGTAT